VKYTVQYPLTPGYDPRLLEPETMIKIAQAAEQSGFSAIAFTDHPAPSSDWLAGGGHDSLDPLTALGFVAGVTRAIRLMPYLLVLPYRNPLLVAKQAATVDVLSAGRLTVTVGTGFLQPEFLALGADFAERNALFDEAVEVMRGSWTTPDFRYDGRHFQATGQAQQPPPVQPGGPPLWIGGNSLKVRRRVARYAQGWSPLLVDEAFANRARTEAVATPEQLRIAVAQLREFAHEQGRADADDIEVQVQSAGVTSMRSSLEQQRDAIGQVADAGATWVVVNPPRRDADRAIAALERFGAEMIGR
jgi:probable F420-dependent oxidoreductase